MGNRRHFYLAADEHLNEAREAGAEVALLLIDLDRFKDINDTLGHQAGDVLLHEVAQRLRRILPAAYVLARLGGDEFVTLLPTTDGPTSAVHSAERFLCALDEPIYVDGLAIRVRASIGIAASHQADDDRATLLRHADVAMYQAKAKGSDLQVYDPDHDMHRRGRVVLASELAAALDTEQIVLYYQPKANLETGIVSSVEALIRRP